MSRVKTFFRENERKRNISKTLKYFESIYIGNKTIREFYSKLDRMEDFYMKNHLNEKRIENFGLLMRDLRGEEAFEESKQIVIGEGEIRLARYYFPFADLYAETIKRKLGKSAEYVEISTKTPADELPPATGASTIVLRPAGEDGEEIMARLVGRMKESDTLNRYISSQAEA